MYVKFFELRWQENICYSVVTHLVTHTPASCGKQMDQWDSVIEWACRTPTGPYHSDRTGLCKALASVFLSCCCGEEEMGCTHLNPTAIEWNLAKTTWVSQCASMKHGYLSISSGLESMASDQWSHRAHQCSKTATRTIPAPLCLWVHSRVANHFPLQRKAIGLPIGKLNT